MNVTCILARSSQQPRDPLVLVQPCLSFDQRVRSRSSLSQFSTAFSLQYLRLSGFSFSKMEMKLTHSLPRLAYGVFAQVTWLAVGAASWGLSVFTGKYFGETLGLESKFSGSSQLEVGLGYLYVAIVGAVPCALISSGLALKCQLSGVSHSSRIAFCSALNALIFIGGVSFTLACLFEYEENDYELELQNRRLMIEEL